MNKSNLKELARGKKKRAMLLRKHTAACKLYGRSATTVIAKMEEVSVQRIRYLLKKAHEESQ
jgi:hypothetical protein